MPKCHLTQLRLLSERLSACKVTCALVLLLFVALANAPQKLSCLCTVLLMHVHVIIVGFIYCESNFTVAMFRFHAVTLNVSVKVVCVAYFPLRLENGSLLTSVAA